jgi:hypothetical protein
MANRRTTGKYHLRGFSGRRKQGLPVMLGPAIQGQEEKSNWKHMDTYWNVLALRLWATRRFDMLTPVLEECPCRETQLQSPQ